MTDRREVPGESPQGRTERRSRRWRRVVGPFLPGLAGTAVLAVLCNLVLELSRLVAVDGNPWNYKTPVFPLLFLLGSAVLWLLIGLVHTVVGRLRVTAAIAATATVVVAVADHEKVQLRREPLYPSDWEFLGNVGFLADLVGVRVVFLLTLGILVTAVTAFVGARALRRRWPGSGHHERSLRTRRARLALRVVTAVLCLLMAGYVSEFNVPGNAVRGAYDALGASWKPWSQQRNYLGNGFVGGFLYNLETAAMTKPADYSAEEMARIAAAYTEAARSINRTRDAGGLDDVNVVMVLSESFSDPEALDGIHLAQDPIPYTRGLMDSTMSGNALAQHIGGGTANMEFEALTGMSMAQFPPQIGVAYQMVVPDYETFPSAVGWFEQSGHRTIAIHPFTTEMYRRREVYRSLGFDEFVYAGTMENRRRIGHDAYLSDAAAYGELEDRLAAEPDPLFVNLVTMQNHMPYTDRYDDPVRVTGPDGEPLTEVGQYARGLAHSDRALQGLIERLRRSDEKTVLVFYGDHLPGIYPDSVFESNGGQVLKQTPFFVWANFPGPDDRQPTTSPAHFMDIVLERANAAMPPYYALLEALRREVPAMGSGMMLDATGRRLEPSELSPRARQLLRDYRLVQYDLSVGHRYSEEVMLGSAPSPGTVELPALRQHLDPVSDSASPDVRR